jgi:hypothetical protein
VAVAWGVRVEGIPAGGGVAGSKQPACALLGPYRRRQAAKKPKTTNNNVTGKAHEKRTVPTTFGHGGDES